MAATANAERSQNYRALTPEHARAQYTRDRPVALNARAGDSTSERAEHAAFARRWWLVQARASLRRARDWRLRFGSFAHSVALHWYLHELEEADRYHRWAHEFGRMR